MGRTGREITPTGITTVGGIAPVGLQNNGTYRHNPDRYYNCGSRKITPSGIKHVVIIAPVGFIAATTY